MGILWPSLKSSWEPVSMCWGKDGNILWERSPTPPTAFPGDPGWPRLSEPLLTHCSPRLSGKGWLAAGVRGHYEDSHCGKDLEAAHTSILPSGLCQLTLWG